VATDQQVTFTPGAPVVLDTQKDSDIHALLLRATSSDGDVIEVHASLRRIVKDAIGAAFVIHLVSDDHGVFAIDTGLTEDEYSKTLSAESVCSFANVAFARQSTQVKVADQLKIICTPVSPPGARGEVLLAGMDSTNVNFQSATSTIELAGLYQQLWTRGSVAAANQWKLNSLAAIVELVSGIEQQESLVAAANAVGNQLAGLLGCTRVAIATLSGDNLIVRSLSGLTQFDPQSESIVAIREALAECRLHDDARQWPPVESQRSAMIAHKALAKQGNFKSLFSSPLKTPDGRVVGAWLFADSGEAATAERFQNFIRTAAPRVASALDVVLRSQRGLVARIRDSFRKRLDSRGGKVSLTIATALMLLLLIPVPYRIRTRCVVEPVARRYAVAPFGGMVDEGLVEPGDIVAKGTLLASMDGRELRWELSATQAKYRQAEKQREVELTERNVPEVLISQFEAERLQTEIAVLRHRMDHLKMKSPIDGVVLSGLLEKGQSTPVEKGDVLYEIGPLDELKIEIEVPATDVAQFREGQRVKIWIDGFESEPVSGQIDQLDPQSQLRQDNNVFVAKVTISNRENVFRPGENVFRPGMRGSARITGPWRPVAWILFHKPWEYLVSRLSWW